MNIGDRAGGYEVVGVLGSGSSGEVWKVREEASGRLEAMAVLAPSSPDDDRILGEFTALAALDHPNLVRLGKAFRAGDRLFVTMELAEGDPVSQQLTRGPMSSDDVIRCANQALDALTYIHSRGVLHGDLRPSNLLVSADGVLKIRRTGIARLLRRSVPLTYASPEQLSGGAVDARSDLYSLAATLYEMVTGKAAGMDSPAPVALIPGTPPLLSDLIMMALAKDPGSRFETAKAMAGAMKTLPVAPRPITALKPVAAPPPVPPPFLATPPAIPVTPATAAPPPPPLPAPAPAPVLAAPPPVPRPAGAVPPPPPPIVAAPVPPAAKPPASMPPPAPPRPVAAPPIVPAAVAVPNSNRGLYITLGGIVTIVVLVLGAFYGPRYFSTGATTADKTSSPGVLNPPAAAQPASVTPDAAPATAAPDTPAQTPPSAQTPPVMPSAQVPTAPAPPPARFMQQPTPAAPKSAAVPSKPDPRARPAGQPATPQAPPNADSQFRPVPQQEIRQAAAPQQAAPQQAPPPQQAAPAVNPALAELRDRHNNLAVQASSLKTSLRSMERQMAASGLGLRGDIKEAETRMDYQMQEAMTSIRAGDVNGAKEHLNYAQNAADTISKFLGR